MPDSRFFNTKSGSEFFFKQLRISEAATNIAVNLMIRSIDKIDDVKMEYSVQITFRYNDDIYLLQM